MLKEAINIGTRIEESGLSIVHLEAIHPAISQKHGMETDIPLLFVTETNPVNSQAGFIAELGQNKMVERIRAVCVDYSSDDINPAYIHSGGRPKDLISGYLVKRFTIPERGLLDPICSKHEGFDPEFSFEISQDGQLLFRRIAQL